MAQITVNGGSTVSTDFLDILNADSIIPGADAGYTLCKQIYIYHPFGGKIVDQPIKLAQSQKRIISVPVGPEDRLKRAFDDQWKKDRCDASIANLASVSQIYGAGSLGLLQKNGNAVVDAKDPLDLKSLADTEISFNIWDPLNTAGSLVLNQDPNAFDFQKHDGVAVNGQKYHRSRSVTLFNENPIYIHYTGSAFGFVGRSAYQRALFPLKSFLNTMITDDLIATKAGLLVIKVEQPGSIIDGLMQAVGAIKRNVVKIARTENVLQISTKEDVESLNLQNINGAGEFARKNIIENIATAAGRPAKLLLQESFAEGFGEGDEDAKHIAQFVKDFREWMQPAYDFMDKIERRRAWNPDFYKALKAEFPDLYKDKSYNVAFYEWEAAFHAEWPSLLEEPDSEKIKVDDVKLKAILAFVQVLGQFFDPFNKTAIINWAVQSVRQMKLLFPAPLIIDLDLLEANLEEQEQQSKDSAEAALLKPPDAWSAKDAIQALDDAVGRLPLSGREKRDFSRQLAHSAGLIEDQSRVDA